MKTYKINNQLFNSLPGNLRLVPDFNTYGIRLICELLVMMQAA